MTIYQTVPILPGRHRELQDGLSLCPRAGAVSFGSATAKKRSGYCWVWNPRQNFARESAIGQTFLGSACIVLVRDPRSLRPSATPSRSRPAGRGFLCVDGPAKPAQRQSRKMRLWPGWYGARLWERTVRVCGSGWIGAGLPTGWRLVWRSLYAAWPSISLARPPPLSAL